MKTIIAATNFSKASNHAVSLAADIARAVEARLIIFNVIDVSPITFPGVPFYPLGYSQEAAEKELSDLKKEMEERVNHEIEITILTKAGTLISQLNELCRTEQPFAVFIASALAPVFERLMLGRHAVLITRFSAYPVIVVPPDNAKSEFKKIALAIDLADNKPMPWQFIRNWVDSFKAQLNVIYVSPDKMGIPEDVPMSIEIGIQLGNYNVKEHLIKNKNVVDGIREYILENKPDLLVMFVQKHGIFHKSVTRRFVDDPPIPVMFISSNLVGVTPSISQESSEFES